MENTSITLSAPATTANLGAGFDALGGALNIRNEVVFFPGKPFSVKIYGEGSNSLPRTKENLLIKAYEATFQEFGEKIVEGAFILKNRIPLSRGLGSSAAATILGSSLAASLINCTKEERDEVVLRVALKFEGHPDNIVPCYYGGIQICVESQGKINNFPLPLPSELAVVLVIPRKKISTQKARKVLGKKVSIEQAVFNIQRSCLFVWSIDRSDFRWLREAMEDSIHQEKRLSLIDGAPKFFKEAIKHPLCISGWLSGSGSTMAFATKKNDSKNLEEDFEKILEKLKFEARLMVTEFTDSGIIFF